MPMTAPNTRFAIRRLRRAELPVATVALARYLIGKLIVRERAAGRLIGRIVETEAYPPQDPAAHHYRGQTPRNGSMYLSRGHAYVYFTYGNHFMLNVSAEEAGTGGGVLIRALEPLEGIELMKAYRDTTDVLDLTRGPGRLAEAMQIDRRLDGTDLCAAGPIWLARFSPVGRRLIVRRATEPQVLRPGTRRGNGRMKTFESLAKAAPMGGSILSSGTAMDANVGVSVRIGITRAAHEPLRFYERGNPFVSGTRRLNSQL
jgi:DNA-3-methyladenine glycosylase